MFPRSIQWQDQSPSDSQDVRERLDPGKRRCYSPVGVDFDDGRNRGGLSALLLVGEVLCVAQFQVPGLWRGTFSVSYVSAKLCSPY